MREAEVIRFAAYILRRLYCESDVEDVISAFAPDITWIGAGEEEATESFEETAAFFRRYWGARPKCEIWDAAYQVTDLGGGCWLCGVRFSTGPAQDRKQTPQRQRVSFVFRREAEALKCVHIHASSPSRQTLQESGHLDKTTYDYLKQRLRDKERKILAADETRRRAYEELERTSRQMQVLLKACRGGLKSSRDDENYSYSFVSDELCAIFGYTKEEFLAMSGGSAVGAVYPPDLPRVLRECEEAFAGGGLEYAIKYRIRCKDGSLRWIIDSGKKSPEEGIIQSIYLDVTELEKANRKIAEQKEMLNNIYESILCGVLRYRVLEDSSLLLSMNREALRLLGYESQEECRSMGTKLLTERIPPEERQRFMEGLRQLKKPGDSFRQEYQLLSPRGRFWVYVTTELLEDPEDKPLLQSILVDMTEKKQLELDLEKERQRFRIAIESTPAMIFEYDMEEDRFTSYGTLEETAEKHNVEMVLERFFREDRCTQVRDGDRPLFRQLLYGQAGSTLELRMAAYYGSREDVWARVTVTVLNSGGKPARVIGKIVNIQSEKEKEFALIEAKSQDALTGLYTREAGIRLVRECLENKSPQESCGMMILDMDDFTKINNEEGSAFADAILQDVADILRAETGPEDIRIRLGGDEFMLFVRNCTKERATVLGPRIAEQIRHSVTLDGKDIAVSASIGMCVTMVVEEYSGLYRCAESTLKYVKEHGKGHAACYLDTSNELGVVLTQLYTEEHAISGIDRQVLQREENLVSFALELLGKANNLDDAIFLLLARVGKICGFDRITIVDVDPEYLSYRFTHQWARDRANLKMHREYYVSKDEYLRICECYDDEGLCEYNPLKGVLDACLHAAIWDHGVFVGAMSFEVQKKGYQWNKDERKLLKELVKIIPSFIMKARADAVSQAKTDFLSRMSHEIRTPMNAISGMTTIAKTLLDDKEKTMECLTKIENANGYLLELINDILDMSRIESGKVELHPESMDLAEFIRNLEALFQPQAALKEISLAVENLYTSGRRVLADALKLNQVMVNVIGNALKFTEPGGSVVVRLEPLEETKTELSLRISVRDTGVGIAPDALGRIFKAFEQAEKHTASRFGGTGLGLAISGRLVQLMGGWLEVRSQLGKGSEFYFSLNLPFTEAAPAQKQEGCQAQYDFAGKRILLAEDNALNQEIAQTILELQGFVVETAADGREAVERFAGSPLYYYDAVLMDIRMPFVDGLEATRRIRTLGRADSRHVPIIAMTGNAFDEDTRKSLDSGMNGHLSKPIQVDLLLETLSGCIQKREWELS